MRKISILAVALCLGLATLCLCSQRQSFGVEYPGGAPGKAQGTCSKTMATLENDVVKMSWSVSDGHLRPNEFVGKVDDTRLALNDSECFTLSTVRSPHPKRQFLNASEMKMEGTLELKRVDADSKSVRLANRYPGWRLEARLFDPGTGLKVKWNALLRDGSNYIRQSIDVSAGKDPVEIVELILFDGKVPEAQVAGKIDGSPIVGKRLFLGIEDPGASSSVTEGTAKCSYPYYNAVAEDKPFSLDLVVGVYPSNRLRRAFLYYLERERACPYRTFLHHNNGERIGEDYYRLIRQKKMDEAAAYRANQEKLWIDIMRKTGEAMKKRGFTLTSYVHDYQWDDEFLVWQFHNGYPNGFTPAANVVSELHSKLGIWFSPWGGYSGRKFRVQGGPAQGLELNQQYEGKGFSLAGTRYYARFRAAAVNMIRDYDVNYFKFDGFLGSVHAMGPGEYRSDFEALWRLLAELRQERPDVFINTSTGSWPSPFWLLRTDAIWRGGSDTGTTGAKGSPRQQWMTFRDSEVLNRVLANGPLFPISSLMTHGLMVNKGGRVTSFNEQDIIDETYSFFATGVNLQELYIDPEVMNDRLWDAVCEAAAWSKSNTDTLADVHWVGGDPAKLEVYGWAAWSPDKAILSLRNPDDKAATISLDLAEVFELSPGAAKSYSLKSPWKKDAQSKPIVLSAGKPHTFELKPFEVVTFDVIPQ